MEILSTTANDCGRRQLVVCLRAELGERIVNKTVLNLMLGAGVDCGIRREADCHHCKSYRGVVGETFGNAAGRGLRSPPRRLRGPLEHVKTPG